MSGEAWAFAVLAAVLFLAWPVVWMHGRAVGGRDAYRDAVKTMRGKR